MFTIKRSQHRLSEKGSISVLVAFLIPIMILMVVLVVDIGQLVIDKIRLQNAADACALAAATVQSAGLNEIADLNNELRLNYKKLINILNSGIWHSLGEGRKAIEFYEKIFKHIRKYQMAANKSYAAKAKQVATRVMHSNRPAGSAWSINSDSNPILMGYTLMPPRIVEFIYLPGSCKKCPIIPTKKWSNDRAGNPAFNGTHDGRYPSSRQALLPPLPYFTGVKVRIKKVGQTTYSGITLTQNPKGFALGSSLFGRMPSLDAYAKAKPAGGHIYNCKPEYRPLMIE
jgi:hypothetical protein